MGERDGRGRGKEAYLGKGNDGEANSIPPVLLPMDGDKGEAIPLLLSRAPPHGYSSDSALLVAALVLSRAPPHGRSSGSAYPGCG